MNQFQKELHHFLELHEWRKFSTTDLEYRYCEICGRLEFEFNGDWVMSKLPAKGFTSKLYMDVREAASKAGVVIK